MASELHAGLVWILTTNSATIMLQCILDISILTISLVASTKGNGSILQFPLHNKWKHFWPLCITFDVELKHDNFHPSGEGNSRPSSVLSSFQSPRLAPVGTHEAQLLAPLSPSIQNPTHYLADPFGDSVSMTESI